MLSGECTFHFLLWIFLFGPSCRKDHSFFVCAVHFIEMVQMSGKLPKTNLFWLMTKYFSFRESNIVLFGGDVEALLLWDELGLGQVKAVVVISDQILGLKLE